MKSSRTYFDIINKNIIAVFIEIGAGLQNFYFLPFIFNFLRQTQTGSQRS